MLVDPFNTCLISPHLRRDPSSVCSTRTMHDDFLGMRKISREKQEKVAVLFAEGRLEILEHDALDARHNLQWKQRCQEYSTPLFKANH